MDTVLFFKQVGLGLLIFLLPSLSINGICETCDLSRNWFAKAVAAMLLIFNALGILVLGGWAAASALGFVANNSWCFMCIPFLLGGYFLAALMGQHGHTADDFGTIGKWAYHTNLIVGSIAMLALFLLIVFNPEK